MFSRRTIVALGALFGCALCATTALAARPATRAGIVDPPPPNSTIPALITLVGHDAAGTPDPVGTFTVVVRDLANNPVVGAEVVVDFERAPEMQLCSSQAGGLTINPHGIRGVSAVTGPDGAVTMTLAGYCVPAVAPSGPNALRIYADGVLLGSPSCAALNLDGAGGLSGADLSIFLVDFISLSGTVPARSDYDHNGTIGGGDLAIWAHSFIAAQSALGCTSAPLAKAP